MSPEEKARGLAHFAALREGDKVSAELHFEEYQRTTPWQRMIQGLALGLAYDQMFHQDEERRAVLEEMERESDEAFVRSIRRLRRH